MTEFRISWRNGDMRGAEWVSGGDVSAATAKFREQKSVMSGYFITSVSKRCGAPIPKRRGVFFRHERFSTCQKLTTGHRCNQHKGV